MRENNWPPHNFDPGLPADHQGIFDPGNDEPEVLLDENGDPVVESDDDFDLDDESTE